ncbi:hypothetical protein [Streptomyces sp. NPDC005989]|uniref:hypothetical protein n=1 Tax=Streptomyces sp. NPDC005989 TaxID=3156727 RepID=UPI003408A72C
MDNSRFLDLLGSLCRRPAMFTGERTITSVAVFLTGYFTGVSHTEPEGPGLEMEWRKWIEMRYDVFNPAWSWTRILLHHHVNDQGVFEVLPSLFRQFLAERDARGVEELETRHRNQFGDRSPAPEHTHTADPR